MYHQITAYDHVIAYYRLALVVIEMEAMINYLASIKLRHAKRHFDVMCHALHAIGFTIISFVRPHLAFIVFSVFYFNCAAGSSAVPQTC